MTIGVTHLLLAGALASCVAGITGYSHGVGMGEAKEQAAQKRADDAREAERRKLQGQIDAATERHQSAEYARQGAVREIHHESERIVERPVYRNLCIDADGVGLLDSAAGIANGEGVGVPAGGPPAAAESATN